MNIKVRRSNPALIIMLLGLGGMLLAGLLNETGVVLIDGASNWMFRLFLAGVILPGFLLFCAMWFMRKKTVLSIGDHEIELHSGILLRNILRIRKSSILGIRTNWKGPNTDSPSDLIFALDAEAAAVAESSSVLRKRQEGWHFQFAATEITAFEAVDLLRRQLSV